MKRAREWERRVRRNEYRGGGRTEDRYESIGSRIAGRGIIDGSMSAIRSRLNEQLE